MYWSAPFTAGSLPNSRYHHASTIVTTNENSDIYMVVLGGLDQSICPMEICYLKENETKENAEWEKLKEMDETEKLTNELAGNTVIDHKKYLGELEQLIMEEKMKTTEYEKEFKSFEKNKLEHKSENEHKLKKLQNEENELENEHKQILNNIETMFLMIKQEQLLEKEILQKNRLLENTIQKVQDYMINLDQFSNAISKSLLKLIIKLIKHSFLKKLGQFDDADPKEASLKKLIINSKEEIGKAREEHKESLYKLKKAYEKINVCLNKNEADLEAHVK